MSTNVQTATFTDEQLDKLADAVALRVIQKMNRRKNRGFETTPTMTFEEARQMLFHGKSRSWIKFYIINRYPENFTDQGGCMTPPRGSGVPQQVIDVDQAQKWVKSHEHTIDWAAPEPITLERRMGLK